MKWSCMITNASLLDFTYSICLKFSSPRKKKIGVYGKSPAPPPRLKQCRHTNTPFFRFESRQFRSKTGLRDDGHGDRTSCGCNLWGWAWRPGAVEQLLKTLGKTRVYAVLHSFCTEMSQLMLCTPCSIQVSSTFLSFHQVHSHEVIVKPRKCAKPHPDTNLDTANLHARACQRAQSTLSTGACKATIKYWMPAWSLAFCSEAEKYCRSEVYELEDPKDKPLTLDTRVTHQWNLRFESYQPQEIAAVVCIESASNSQNHQGRDP